MPPCGHISNNDNTAMAAGAWPSLSAMAVALTIRRERDLAWYEARRQQRTDVYCAHLNRHGCGLYAAQNPYGLCRPCAFFCTVSATDSRVADTDTRGLSYNDRTMLELAMARGVMFCDSDDVEPGVPGAVLQAEARATPASNTAPVPATGLSTAMTTRAAATASSQAPPTQAQRQARARTQAQLQARGRVRAQAQAQAHALALAEPGVPMQAQARVRPSHARAEAPAQHQAQSQPGQVQGQTQDQAQDMPHEQRQRQEQEKARVPEPEPEPEPEKAATHVPGPALVQTLALRPHRRYQSQHVLLSGQAEEA